MQRKPILLMLLTLLLFSCGGTTSSASTLTSSTERRAPGQGSWTVNYSSIPETAGEDYNLDFDFATVFGTGVTHGFHGNNLRRGRGNYHGVSVDKTIEMKAGDSYLYSTTARAHYFVVAVRQILDEAGEDITGIPTFYVGEQVGLTGGEKIEFNVEVIKNQGIVLCSYLLQDKAFRMENQTAEPIYLLDLSYPE